MSDWVWVREGDPFPESAAIITPTINTHENYHYHHAGSLSFNRNDKIIRARRNRELATTTTNTRNHHQKAEASAAQHQALCVCVCRIKPGLWGGAKAKRAFRTKNQRTIIHDARFLDVCVRVWVYAHTRGVHNPHVGHGKILIHTHTHTYWAKMAEKKKRFRELFKRLDTGATLHGETAVFLWRIFPI